MSGKVFERKLNQKLERYFPGRVSVKVEDDCIRVSGQLDNWEDIVRACSMCVSKDKRLHVVNDIKLMGTNIPVMRIPKETSKELEGIKPDVLIIGGGISGASIARELMEFEYFISGQRVRSCHAGIWSK